MMQRREWYWLLVLIFVFAAALEAQEKVSGEELVMYRCTECHTLKRVFRAHYDSTAWAEALVRMEDQGLYVEDEERAAVIAFLVSQKERRSLLQLVGMHHFLLLHFPIVLVLLAAFFEALALWRRQALAADHIQLIMRLAVLAGAVVIALGFALIIEREMLPPGLILHRNLGIAAGVFMLVALVCRELAVKRGAPRLVWAYRGVLLLAVIAVGLTADRGGMLVHGNFVQDIMDLLGLV